MAAGGGFKDVAELLFEQGGVDVDHVDIYGRTALDWACEIWKNVSTDSDKVSKDWEVRKGSPVAQMRLDFHTSIHMKKKGRRRCAVTYNCSDRCFPRYTVHGGSN